MEERWTEPRGGLMLGVHRDVKDGRAVSFEFAGSRRRRRESSTSRAPAEKLPHVFAWFGGEVRHAIFENPDHDFPKRILYRLGGDGNLHARVEGNSGDKEKAQEWTWKKGRF
jgi:Domain of unknown function (DUF6265)